MLIGMVLFGACRSEDVYKEGVIVDTAETLSDADGDGYFSDEDAIVPVQCVTVQKSCVMEWTTTVTVILTKE